MLLHILSLGALTHASHAESRGSGSYEERPRESSQPTDQTSLTQTLNGMIASKPGSVYGGGKGVIFRNINDGLSGKAVVPATLIVNDIFAANIAYPHGDPMCPTLGFDGYSKGKPCTADPFLNAVVGVVIGNNMDVLFKDFDKIQDSNWGYGVFYATDSNAADHRCYWVEAHNGWECPGAWKDAGTNKVKMDSRQKGSGAYSAGNPNAGLGGGGAGCHWSSAGKDIDQYDSSQPNLVSNNWCECNYALKGNGWSDWTDQWFYHGVSKPPFHHSMGWFDGGKKQAPNWAVDAAICWVNNPRDMIEMQNMIWFRRWKWSNQLMPSSSWNVQLPETQRYYWGWNEIPLDTGRVDNPSNWDAIVIKLPVAVCGGNGGSDILDCLPVKAKEDLDNQLAWMESNGKMKVGEDNLKGRPGSYVVLLREYEQATNYWQRWFFCQSYIAARYSVVFKAMQGGFPGECYIDRGSGQGPSPKTCNGLPGAFEVNRDKSLCLDISGGHFYNGVPMEIWKCNGLKQQHFIWCDDNRIVSAADTNLCLDMPGGAHPTYLQMWECNGRESQQWGYDSKTGSVYPTIRGEDMCMDIAEGTLKAGTRVNLYPCKPGTGEAWTLVSPPPPPPCSAAVGYFRPRRDMNKCLDVVGGKFYNGAQLQIWDCSGHTNQQFMWCSDNRIASAMNDNYCIDIPQSGSSIQPAYLQMWECNGHTNQQWGYDGQTLDVYPTVTGESLCMDLDSASLKSGTKVNVYPCKAGQGEAWELGNSLGWSTGRPNTSNTTGTRPIVIV